MKYTNRLLRGALAMIMATLPGLLQAQKTGDIISGVVQDAEGPMMMVNVTEKDAADRIISFAITDMEGNFSFRLGNPANRLVISYVGYETVDIPFTKTYYEINMKEAAEIPQVDITAERVQETTGLPIPLREASSVVQTINMEDFESLGITTVDEALQGQVAGLDIVFDSGDLGARSTMRLRGQSTLTGDGNPLIVIDGNILSIDANTQNQFASGLNDYLAAGLEAQNEQDRLAELLSINPSDVITKRRSPRSTPIQRSSFNGTSGISNANARKNLSARLNISGSCTGYLLNNSSIFGYLMMSASTRFPGLDEHNEIEDRLSREYSRLSRRIERFFFVGTL
jgi:hypothetical protein